MSTTSPVKMSGPVRLDELIAAVRATHEAPLEQLSAAVLTSEALDELADSLVGHFVDQARRSGASWTEIGRSMGVTKQAAQKRFVDRTGGQGAGQAAAGQAADGFARYTLAARNAVVVAQNEARAAANLQISPAHLLLGLVSDPESAAVRALAAMGLAVDDVRRAASAALPAPAGDVPALIPFDEAARRVLEGGFGQAERWAEAATERAGVDVARPGPVGTGHLLVALLDDAEQHGGLPGGLTVDRSRAEAEAFRLLAHADPAEQPG